MNDPQGLDVKNISAFTRTVVNPTTGRGVRVTTVSYMVGDHGPFQDDYPPGTFTEAAVKANIAKRVATLRAITNPTNTY
jgi:hypothetical protein